MIHFIKLKLPDPERQPVHVNTNEIVLIQDGPRGGARLELTTGKTLEVFDKPEDILAEVHSRGS